MYDENPVTAFSTGTRYEHGEPNVHTLQLTGSGQFEYEFTVDGEVYGLEDNAQLKSDLGVNDYIEENADGTLTVVGETGTSDPEITGALVGDSFEIVGDLLDLSTTMTQDVGQVEIYADGYYVTEQEAVDMITPIEPDPMCTGDSDCGPAQICENGECVDDPGFGCLVNGDCGPGEVCMNGECVEEPEEGPGAGCVGDGDCPDGYFCEDGLCVEESEPPECSADGDCGDGFVCDHGDCVRDPDDGGGVSTGAAVGLAGVAIIAGWLVG